MTGKNRIMIYGDDGTYGAMSSTSRSVPFVKLSPR
jgi:hypothetical protein